MSTTSKTAGTVVFAAQIHRPGLQKWARRIPRDIGATIIAEAVGDLLDGECSTLKGLPFISRLNARRRHRKASEAPPAPLEEAKPATVAKRARRSLPGVLRMPVMPATLERLTRRAKAAGSTTGQTAASILETAPPPA